MFWILGLFPYSTNNTPASKFIRSLFSLSLFIKGLPIDADREFFSFLSVGCDRRTIHISFTLVTISRSFVYQLDLEMVLYIIGLGLGDHKDITVRGLECVKSSDLVFLEYYTSVLGVNKDVLEEYYGKKIEVADREFVETKAEEIYGSAKDKNVSLLIVGDPLCATTHVDIILRAKKEGIKVEVIHNASAMGAAASCGLQLYQFGYTVSIPWFEENWKPSSYYERIQYNSKGGMHTLCLLDIKVKEPDYESMVKFGKVKYLPPRFMTVSLLSAMNVFTTVLK